MLDTDQKPTEPDADLAAEPEVAPPAVEPIEPPAVSTAPVVELTPDPVAEEPSAIELPQPAPGVVAELPVEPTPPPKPPVPPEPIPPTEAATSPLPESVATPAVPLPAQRIEPVAHAEATVDVQPTPPAPQPVDGIPPAVLALTDAELKVAARYYLLKHQREIGMRGVRARQAHKQKMLDAITAYVRARGSVQIPRLCQDMNISPGLASHYLRLLVIDKSIKADGWAKNRRYFV